MDKTLVVYNSKYGYTKKYAYWLAEELKADICTDKNLKREELNNYSKILFGSSLYASANKAASLVVKHFEQIKDRKVILFTCGVADISSESNVVAINKMLDKIITPEIRKKVKIFHVRGGIDYSKLTFLHKIMMKVPYSRVKKKPENEWTDEERNFMVTYGQKIDFSDKKMLEPIIRYCLNNE